jgi:hypothetical protein
MCCDEADPPAPVAAMLDEYRRLAGAGSFDWGDEFIHAATPLPFTRSWIEYSRYASTADVARTFQAMDRESREWAEAIRVTLAASGLPCGVVDISVGDAGPPDIDAGPLPLAIAGVPTRIVVFLRSTNAERAVALSGDGGRVSPGQTSILPFVLGSATDTVGVDVDGESYRVAAVEEAESATLTVESDGVSRWSVVDSRGGPWFPEGAVQKWDVHGRPFFHAETATIDVPATVLHVTVARGCEFAPASTTVEASPGQTSTVRLVPRRLYDAAAAGWFGGDLHVHLNYSGDFVCAPVDAARMQQGEDLHLLNLVAGNLATARVYDREAFEHWLDDDLPWSGPEHVARFGVEFRNDLFGHAHALGASAPPSLYQTGHERSDHPHDWPPNAVTIAELRAVGSTVGYTHPVRAPLADGTPRAAFVIPRSCEAREVVSDAVLGLVDSLDLLGPSDVDGCISLYHRLLGAGLRLAATAGTDSMLSFSRWGTFSNPPGWARAYADLRGEPLSVAAWQAAVRQGRTFVTNGPWVGLRVADSTPGDTIELAGAADLEVVATVRGLGVETLQIVGPDGPIAESSVTGEHGEVAVTVAVGEPMWIAAIARGGPHPAVLDAHVTAHTSPVYVDVDGRRVNRRADIAWCLDWIARFEDLARTHGSFAHEGQLQALVDHLDEARRAYDGRLAFAT